MLQDKVVIVTGGMGAIGRSITKAFAGRGAKVVVADLTINEQAKAEFESAIADSPGSVVFQELNVTDLEVCQQAIKNIAKQFGSVDILINNAGITRDNLLMRMKAEEWDSVLNVNLTGTFNMCKAVCRTMMKQRQGAIINVSSVAGQMGNAGQANYSASKAGMIGLTKTLARELGSRNIRVNAVAPGFIAVGMTEDLPQEIKDLFNKQIPLGRPGTAEEVAEAICFLADAEYVTGQVLAVNGGLYM